jgi:hypothetical protein
MVLMSVLNLIVAATLLAGGEVADDVKLEGAPLTQVIMALKPVPWV